MRLAVGAERHAGHHVGVPLEDQDLLARPGVPHLHRRITKAARDDALAVGAEHRARTHSGGAP